MTATAHQSGAAGVDFDRYWQLARALFGGTGSRMAQVGDYLVGVAKVTPERAAYALEKHNRHNRKLMRPGAARLAKDIEAGRWALNGETIVFDSDGLLRNGMHRLTACVASGVAIETFVVIGVAPQAFATFDQHSKRTTAQVLGMRGESHAASLASGLTCLHSFLKMGRIGREANSRHLITTADDEELLATHPEMRESAAVVTRVLPARQAGKAGGSGAAVCSHYVFSRVDADLADELWTAIGALSVPVGTQYDPLRRLITLLVDNAAKGDPLGRGATAALIIKGWNAFAAGASARNVSYRATDPYPLVWGWNYDDALLPVGTIG